MNKKFHLAAIFLAFTVSCSAKVTQTVNFNPDEPIRVAVLPFAEVDSSGKFIDRKPELAIDQIDAVSTKLEEKPSQIIRKQVIAELQKTNLDLISPALIDIDLPHHGLAFEDGSFNLPKIFETDSAEICTKFLTCDAILYGRVTRWDRSYYGIESVGGVGVELTLVSAKDRSILFSSSAEDTERRGITKGTTGISDLVIEPIKGLNTDILVNLSRSLVQKMIAPLFIKNRPAFLESSPPSVYASSHDAKDGEIKRGSPLIVVVFGSPHESASFSIGRVIRHVPMIEREAGHYYGEYWALPSDKFEAQPVVAYISDKFGRATEQEIAKGPVTLK